MSHHNHNHNHHNAATTTSTTNDGNGGVSQRVNSPRFSGSMTRRPHSKLTQNNNSNNTNSINSTNSSTNHHEIIDLHLNNSPRSESPVVADNGPAHVAQRVHLRRKIESLNVGLSGFGLELKGRKKLRSWMFLMFCGVCLFMGVFKICATGWFGSALDRLGNNKDLYATMVNRFNLQNQGSHAYQLLEKENGNNIRKNEVEHQTLVAAGVVGGHTNEADHSGIWSKPNSENFTQCIGRRIYHKKVDTNTNGYLLTNANGGLNQMRFGSADL